MGTPLRVLMVEDSEDDALLIMRELKKGGYEPAFERVDTAEAMAAALDKQEWDIITSDCVTPQFSGLDALGLLQEKRLDLPFIIVSGKISEDTAVEVMRAGAHDCIMKGNLTRLVPVVTRELYKAEVRREKRQAEQRLRDEMVIKANLLEIAEAIAYTTDIDNMLKEVLLAAQRITGCDACLSYLWEREAKVFRPAHAIGLSQEMVPFFGTEPISDKAPLVRKAFEGRRPVITEFGSIPNLTGWLKDINTVVLIPLIVGAVYLGLIICTYKYPREFTERDKKIMEGISRHVSIACIRTLLTGPWGAG